MKKRTPQKKSVGYRRFEKWLSQFIWWQNENGDWVLRKDNHIKN